MCIGIPMRIIESGEGYALCETNGRLRRIDTLLVGEQPVGSWLLTFLDSAREVLTPESAARIADALRAVNLATQGETRIDHLFQDLIGREPELPRFLRDSAPEHSAGD